MVLLVVVNFGNVIAEFSGIAGSLQLFHVSKYASVPICALAVWALVVKGDYKSVEKIFSDRQRVLYLLHHCRGAGAAGLAYGAGGDGEGSGARGLERPQLCVYGDWRDWDDDYAVDAVLSAVVDCGEGRVD